MANAYLKASCSSKGVLLALHIRVVCKIGGRDVVSFQCNVVFRAGLAQRGRAASAHTTACWAADTCLRRVARSVGVGDHAADIVADGVQRREDRRGACTCA